ncbi:DCK1 [Candida oxycetoniae]|uniref:Acyl carrier protein n=1 Tax=Candida oxycetoniae TaxID=497107 RepID=A0AAI9T263_9ASCO|nr:DCK1 [Candida oxycetoniae]KAI3406735.2 DCK1 [Candida oxycetoniae]
MTWVSTEAFLNGKILKPFLPNDKHPKLKNPNLKNLYPGDQVFIFEVKDDKWARGYVLVRPMPQDFLATSANLDDLPVEQYIVVVFPLRYVKVISEIPFPKSKTSQEFDSVVDTHGVPSIYQSENDHKEAVDGTDKAKDTRQAIPSMPNNNASNSNICEEIKHTLELLTCHIFALYAIGEFKLYDKLSFIYRALQETTIKLTFNLLTEEEHKIAIETATFLLNEISKKLASRSLRINTRSFDLDNDYTDVSGYKTILARDSNSGELLNLKNSTPSLVALNSELAALVTNYPINVHNNPHRFTLEPPPNKKFQHDPPSHILVDFKSVSGSSAYQPPGYSGTTAYLYLRNNDKRLTEAFAIHTESVHELVHVEKISAALFKNLPSSEIVNNRVFLVAVLTEEVELNLKSTTTQLPSLKKVKKGVAAGVADITRIFSHNEGSLVSGEAHRFSIKLFGSYVNKKVSSKRAETADDSSGWGEVVDRIISGSGYGIAVNPRAERLIVTVKEFKHQLNDQNSNYISSSAPISRIKPIFFDPLAENYERIYLKLGKISLINEKAKDDLLTIEVSTPNNELITFAKASNQQEKRFWQFISVFSGESIGEIAKVNGIALKGGVKKSLNDDHIILSLYVNGVLAGEGKLLYRSGNRLVEFNKKKQHSIEIMSVINHAPMAHIELSTEYVGKIYNSDVSIDNIFQYESFFQQGPKGVDELSNSLATFCRLEVRQLIKYFPELLTSLYGIIETSFRHTGPSVEILEENVFKAIIHLLDNIFGKQDQYSYLVEEFTFQYKRSDQIGIYLLDKLREVFRRSEAVWNSLSRSVCRVMFILMRLAIVPPVGSKLREDYIILLNDLYKSITLFLSIDSQLLIDDQILILDIVDYVYVFQVNMENRKVLQLMITFINSIGLRGAGADELNQDTTTKRANKSHKVIISKMLLILRLLHTPLMDDEENRRTFIAKSIQWVMEIFVGLTDVEATRLGCSIINSVCTILWEKVIPLGNPLDIEMCYSLAKFLPTMARTFIKYNKFIRGNGLFKSKRVFTQLFPTAYPFKTFSIDQNANDETLVEILIELTTCFAFIARIGKATAGDEGYEKILNTKLENDFFDASKYLAAVFESEDLLTVLSGIRYFRLGKYFAEERWVSLFAVIIEGCMCALELIRPLIVSYQLPLINESDLFDRVLWGNYIKSLLKIAVLPPVAVEHLSRAPRRACVDITRDIRDRAAVLLNEAWDSLSWEATEEDMIRFNLDKFGGYQVEFINDEFGILPELMMFGLQRNYQCQGVAVKILWSLLIAEYILNDSLEEVEKECLIGLFEIFQKFSYKPSKEDQDNFIKRMKLTIRIDREDVAFGVFYGFIQNLSTFFATLNYYISVPVGPEFDEDRMFHQIKLRAQIKAAGKPEYFNAFVSSMYDDHVRKEDFVQAALSLELLASTYVWSHHKVVPASFRLKFPQQSSFDRKEILYKMIASNFIKGNSLEKAADTFNELLDAYNEHTYDLKSFALVHSKLAQLYLDLESSDKLEPSYFRVEAIGTGFPMYMRMISQIYQGLPYEHITSIHERLLKMFPGAIIVNEDAEAQKLKEEEPTGRYLHIKAVEPMWEFSDKLFNASLGVRQYARNKDLKCFSSLKRIPGSTSVFDLWTEQTTYETWLSFPTLFNRSFIKDAKTIRLSPLDNAIRTISRKNDDLILLESLINADIKDKNDYSNHFNDLSRQLSGTVDSPVNGGVGQYRLFFTDPKYLESEEDSKKAMLLNKAFNELAIILNRCLVLHGKLIAPSMKMAHEALLDLFQSNFKAEIDFLQLGRKNEPMIPASKVSIFQEKRSGISSSSERSSFVQNSSTYAPSMGSSLRAGNDRLNRTITKSSMHSGMSGSGSRSGTISEYAGGGHSTTSGFVSTTAGYSQFSGLASRSVATNGMSMHVSISSSSGQQQNKTSISSKKKVTALNASAYIQSIKIREIKLYRMFRFSSKHIARVARLPVQRVSLAQPIRFYVSPPITRDEVVNRAFEALKTVAALQESKLSLESSFQKDLGLDSLDTVEALVALEEEFDLEIPDKIADEIKTVGEAVDYILKEEQKE